MKSRIVVFAVIAAILLVVWSLRRGASPPVSNEPAVVAEVPSRGTQRHRPSGARARAVPRFTADTDARIAESEAADGIVVVGRVVAHDTGSPLDGVRVQVVGTASLLPIETATGTAGHFKLTNLIAGPAATLSFDIADRSHVSESRRVPLPTMGTVDAGTIRLLRTDPRHPSSGALGLRLSSQDGRAVVRALQPGAAAERAGLRLNDVILEIDGEEPVGDEIQLVAALRANPGEHVTMLVRTADQRPRLLRLARVP